MNLRRTFIGCCLAAALLPCAAQDGKLAFINGSGVFVANEDGTNPRRVATGDRERSNVKWSPDGRKLLWLSTKPNSKRQLAVVGTESGRILARIPVLVYGEEQQRWFPVRVITWTGWLSNTAFYTGGDNAPGLCMYDVQNSVTGQDLNEASETAWGCAFTACPAKGLSANIIDNKGGNYVRVNGAQTYSRPSAEDQMDSDLLWSSDCAHLAFIRTANAKATLIVLRGAELEAELPLPDPQKISRFVVLPTGYAVVLSEGVLYYESGSKHLRTVSRDDAVCKAVLDRIFMRSRVLTTFLTLESVDFWPPIVEDSTLLEKAIDQLRNK